LHRSGINSDGLSKAEFNDTLPQRFASKCGQADSRGCTPWLGYKNANGYGVLRTASTHSRKTCAHRIAWVLKHGDLPPKVLVLHRCDNPSCVNVDHLFLGTQQANVDDMVSKSRHSWRDGTPWQKLNATDGERVRDLRRAGCTQQEVADWLGVSRPLISMIEHGKVQHSSISI
jgi:hypothetical protein